MKEQLEQEYREADHWFFRARRTIFTRLLDELVPLSAAGASARQPRILDLGPGSGVNAPVLVPRGEVTVVDVAQLSLDDCGRRGAANLVMADATRPPFEDGSFDLICALDILEHLDDDQAALRECRRLLSPGGTLFVTVPAWGFLWGRQDVQSEHRRRYRLGQLRERMQAAGFEFERSSYFNFLLFPPIALVRLLMRPFLSRTAEKGSDLRMRLPFGGDQLLYAIFASEAGWLTRRNLPWGVSLLALAHPRSASTPNPDSAGAPLSG